MTDNIIDFKRPPEPQVPAMPVENVTTEQIIKALAARVDELSAQVASLTNLMYLHTKNHQR